MEKRLQGQRSLGNPALDRFNRYFYYVNRHCVFEEGDKLHRGYPKKKRTHFFWTILWVSYSTENTWGNCLILQKSRRPPESLTQLLVACQDQNPGPWLTQVGGKASSEPVYSPVALGSARAPLGPSGIPLCNLDNYGISVPPQKTRSLIPRHLLELVDRLDLFIYLFLNFYLFFSIYFY